MNARRQARRPDWRQARRGVSLIEVMVALTLFGLIATVHTVATMRYSMGARVVALGAARTASVATAVDLFSTMPRGAIAAAVGCASITDLPNYPHMRCIAANAVTGTMVRVQIIITPTNTALRPDTVFVDRVTGSATSVFN